MTSLPPSLRIEKSIYPQRTIPYISQGIAYGTVAGMLASLIAGPEISDFVLGMVQPVTEPGTLGLYRELTHEVAGLPKNFDTVMTGFYLSIPTIQLPASFVGLAKGVYDKVASMRGRKPVKTNDRTWLDDSRFWRAFRVVRRQMQYRAHNPHSMPSPNYLGVRHVTIETIAYHRNDPDVGTIGKALDTVVAEEASIVPIDERPRHKLSLMDDLAEYAAFPDKATIKDRTIVTMGRTAGLELFALVATYLGTLQATGSLLKAAVAGFLASLATHVVVAPYAFSALDDNCKAGLERRREHKGKLYESFEHRLAVLKENAERLMA